MNFKLLAAFAAFSMIGFAEDKPAPKPAAPTKLKPEVALELSRLKSAALIATNTLMNTDQYTAMRSATTAFSAAVAKAIADAKAAPGCQLADDLQQLVCPPPEKPAEKK